MPTNGNQFNPQDEQNQQDDFMSHPVSISGSEAEGPATGAMSNSAQGQAPTNASQKPTSSGRFQNLNAYLNANKNFNKDTGGLAGSVNQNLTSKSNDLQRNFAQAKQDYQTNLDNARQRYDQQFVGNAIQNPIAVSQNEGDLKKFEQQRDAQYQGPTELDPQYQLRGQAENFSNMANQTGTESGRFNLLRQLYDRPTYTAGQQSLDNLFLQADPSQLANLQNSKIIGSQVNNSLGDSLNGAQLQAKDAENEAANTRLQTRNALSGAITGFDSNMDTAVQQALAGRQKKFDDEQGALYRGELGSDEALNFGLLSHLGDAESQPIYNLNLQDYLQQNNIDPTKQSVASADDYNRIAALGKLSGNVLNSDTSQILDRYNTPSQAGSFQKLDPYSFNTSQYQNDRNRVEAQYRNAYTPERAKYDDVYTKLYGGDSLIGDTGNTKGTGGIMGEIGRKSVDERNRIQGQFDYLTQLADQMKVPVEQLLKPGIYDTKNVSDLDILSRISNPVYSGGDGNYFTGQYQNPYADLIQSAKSNQQKQINAEQTLKQLTDSYGANRKVKITDADKYKPVEIAPNPINGLPGLGGDIFYKAPDEGNVERSLNNIYNRI